jgi:hypothetical protein
MEARNLKLAALALSLAMSACKKDDDKPTGDAKAETKTAPQSEPSTKLPGGDAEAAGSVSDRLLAWLDPDAVAVAWIDLPPGVDVDALSVVFAIPPKLEELLSDVHDIEEGLDAIRPLESPPPSEWLGPQALASAALVSTGTYVLRPLTKPRAEVEKLLLDSGMEKTDAEGFTILVPQNAFGWKAAFMTDDVIAFIPAKEVGTGLSPLTAGRDMPPSEVEGQIRTALKNETGVALEAYAAGPLLHYDLGQDVLQVALQARTWKGGGLDVAVRLLPGGDASQAVDKLSHRETPLESDQIQSLAHRVAFSLDGEAISGRLQLTETDMAVLRGGA